MITRVLKRVALAVVGLLALAVAAGAWLWQAGGGCENSIQQRITSPDGQREAVVFERSCGATTDYSTQVSVLRHGGRLPNRPGNAFIYGHQVPLSVQWDAPLELRVAYPPGFQSLTEAQEIGGVRIRYAEDQSILAK
jgi:hypothetical protein